MVHGAGSFGHPQVLASKIHLGIYEEKQLVSFAEVQSWQNLLNFIITREMQKRGIPAIPIQPSAIAIVKKGRIIEMFINTISQLLNIGMVPVLYGVPALDVEQKCSILSGDELVAYLAKKLMATMVIHGTDVDGVFTKDPKRHPDAKLIREITNENLQSVLQSLSKSKFADVTGGMYSKIVRLVDVAKRGIKCLVINAEKKGTIYKALIGEKVLGSTINLSKS